MAFGSGAKRLLLGRALRTEQPQSGGIERRRAIPAFSSDALSSNVYATQEILIVLAIGGAGMLRYGWMVAAAVAAVFAVIVTAYRYTVRNYPTGGGDYDVAAANLGPGAAVVVGSAMLIDFALTLAVSVAAILDVMVSVTPDSDGARLAIGIAVVVGLALLSLRGSQNVAILLRICSFGFVIVIVVMLVVAIVEVAMGEPPRAASADWQIVNTGPAVTGFALFVVLARAFSSGSVAVTGVEATGTAVPTFRQPRGENAARALVMVAIMWMTAFASITWLAELTGVRVTADDADLIGAHELPQQTVLVQLADAVFGNSPAVVLVAAAAVLVLAGAGINSYRSFSVLTSVLARDGFLPRQLQSRGDRLVYSNGIITLAVGAGMLLWWSGTSLTALIQLYVVGVFLALTLGQAGMVRHWSRALAGRLPQAERPAAQRARSVALVGQSVAGAVLVVVVVSKFFAGAWIVVLAIPLLALAMRRVQRQYDLVAYEVAATEAGPAPASAHVTALILVSSIRKPTLRAVAYARATRPTTLEAVTVAVDTREAQHLRQEWEARDVGVPLTILESPFREINSPVISYVQRLRASDPDTVLTVYVPEYVVSHWWEELLHNQSAARLKRRLMGLRDVVVITVPWQLSAERPVVPAPTVAVVQAPAAMGSQPEPE